jgi:hypothetical protein
MINPIFGISIWLVIKIAALLLLAMYLVFALIMVRQIRLMTSTLSLGFDAPIILLGYIHLAFAVLVFLAALIIL